MEWIRSNTLNRYFLRDSCRTAVKWFLFFLGQLLSKHIPLPCGATAPPWLSGRHLHLQRAQFYSSTCVWGNAMGENSVILMNPWEKGRKQWFQSYRSWRGSKRGRQGGFLHWPQIVPEFVCNVIYNRFGLVFFDAWFPVTFGDVTLRADKVWASPVPHTLWTKTSEIGE